MKVVHLITNYDSRGGAERMLCNLMHEVSSCHHWLFSLHQLDPNLYDDLRAFSNVTIGVGYGGRSNPARLLSAACRFAGTLRSVQPDCIVSWMYHANLFALMARWLARADYPVVWNVRNSLEASADEGVQQRCIMQLSRRLSKYATAIVYNSARSMTQHAAYGFHAQRSHWVPNGVDTRTFRPSSAPRTRKPGAPLRVGSLGRHHPMKNLEGLLVAMQLIRGVCDFELAVKGKGVSDGRLARKARELGILDLCTFEEDDAHPEQFLQTLDLFVLPSISEGFPNALSEAMACGIPCVTTDVGDAARIVGHAGEVAHGSDPGQIADGIRRMIVRMGTEASVGALCREHLTSSFSLQSSAGEFVKIWSGAAARVDIDATF